MKNRAFMKKTLLAAVLCAALSAFMGCDDGSKDPERETYTVTYNANGGSGTAPSAQTANSGSSVTLSGQGSLTYSGKTFNGWNTNSAGTGTAYTAGASLTVAGNSTLYAQWTAVQYTVTYNANGGSGNAPSAQTVNAGSSATLSGKGSLTYSGKTFDGWNTNSSGTGTAYAAGASLTVAGNVTLYAQWISQNAGGVTYVLRPNPGYDDYVCVADDMLPAGFAVNAGDQVTISFSVKTGVPLSTFTIGIADWTNGGGWTAPGWDDPKEVAADGQYHSVEWTLTAAASGPAGDNPLAIQFSTSGASEPEIAIYVRDVSINGGGETDPPAPAQYTVTFNTDGTTETRTVSGGGTVGSNMPSNPAKSGYSFDGWYTAQNGGGSQFTASTPVTGSITVYAKWSYTGETDPPAPAQYTVTFDTDGTTEMRTVSGGGTVGSMPSNPAKSGYSFDGWYTAQNGGGSQFTASSPVTGSITVYAKWSYTGETDPPAPAQYTVTYNANGGSGTAPSSQTVNAGSSVTIAGQGSLTYSGKTFTGWNTNYSGTGTPYSAGSSITVSGDVNLYAQWQEITVTLTAPRIDTTKSKDMTSDGMGFIIYLSTSSSYIDSQTQSYKLYRSTSQYSGYSSIATIPASASTLVFEDKNISFVEGVVYHYKVAAVYGSSETMSTNAMMVTIAPPSITMRRSTTTTSYGYCGIGLLNSQMDQIWYETTSASKPSFIVDGVPEGTYTLYTKTSSSGSYVERRTVTFMALNKYTIYAVQGTVDESLDTSNWSFFTP